MDATKDALPRVFQANLGRLFERVILPVLDSLPHHPTVESGMAATLDQFFDRAAAQIDNYTGNEAAKAFTLILAGVFERQLSIWARAIHDHGLTDMSPLCSFEALLAGYAKEAGIDLTVDCLGEDLTQMFVVANVVRHGEGPSCDRLRALAPELWDGASSDYLDLLPGKPVASEHLRIRKTDLVRYIRAATRFWGLAEPQPLAIANPPY